MAPYVLDARRCISYLTIEHHGSIPEALRPLLGNRIYGCDDCQLVCPWNSFAQRAAVPDFEVRNGLDGAALSTLFSWSEEEFLERMQGSAIRRLGHERWLRNLAVALGNAPTTSEVVEALRARRAHSSALVREHVEWALVRHGASELPSAELSELGEPEWRTAQMTTQDQDDASIAEAYLASVGWPSVRPRHPGGSNLSGGDQA